MIFQKIFAAMMLVNFLFFWVILYLGMGYLELCCLQNYVHMFYSYKLAEILVKMK